MRCCCPQGPLGCTQSDASAWVLCRGMGNGYKRASYALCQCHAHDMVLFSMFEYINVVQGSQTARDPACVLHQAYRACSAHGGAWTVMCGCLYRCPPCNNSVRYLQAPPSTHADMQTWHVGNCRLYVLVHCSEAPVLVTRLALTWCHVCCALAKTVFEKLQHRVINPWLNPHGG